MRIGLVALAVVVGCGGHPPHKRAIVRAPDDTVRGPYVAPTPPSLRILLPAPNGLAWPLTTPPTLEPNYRSVTFLWPSVCDQRGVLPDDVLAYTEAWCAYAKSGSFELARALAPLRASRVPRLRDAIVLDLANLAADRVTTDRVPWDGELQETIIAIEIELGRIDDATDAAKAYLKYLAAHRTSSCGADLVKWMFDPDPDALAVLPRQMHMYGSTSCGMQFRKLGCIIWKASGNGPTTECDGVVLDENERAISRAATARLRWSPQTSAEELVEIGRYAASAMVLPDAEGFAIATLQRALQSSCRMLDNVREIVKDIDADARKQEQFAEARAALIAMTADRCEEYRLTAK